MMEIIIKDQTKFGWDIQFTSSIFSEKQKTILYPLWASCQIRNIAGAHEPGMPGTFSPPQRVSDPDMHHGTCVTHVPRRMTGSLTSDFFEVGGGRKRSRYSRRMRNLQIYVYGKRPMTSWWPHYMETISALLFAKGIHRSTLDSPTKWFEASWWPCDVTIIGTLGNQMCLDYAILPYVCATTAAKVQ